MNEIATESKPVSLFTETPLLGGNGIRLSDVIFWLSLPGELAAVQKRFALAAMRDGHGPELGEEAYDRLLGMDYSTGRITSILHAIRASIRYCRLGNWRQGVGFPHRGARSATYQRACFLNGGDAIEPKPVGRSYASLPDRSPTNPSVLAGIFELGGPSLREEIVGVAGECETPTGKTVYVWGGTAYGKVDHRQRRGYPRKFEACTVKE